MSNILTSASNPDIHVAPPSPVAVSSAIPTPSGGSDSANPPTTATVFLDNQPLPLSAGNSPKPIHRRTLSADDHPVTKPVTQASQLTPPNESSDPAAVAFSTPELAKDPPSNATAVEQPVQTLPHSKSETASDSHHHMGIAQFKDVVICTAPLQSDTPRTGGSGGTPKKVSPHESADKLTQSGGAIDKRTPRAPLAAFSRWDSGETEIIVVATQRPRGPSNKNKAGGASTRASTGDLISSSKSQLNLDADAGIKGADKPTRATTVPIPSRSNNSINNQPPPPAEDRKPNDFSESVTVIQSKPIVLDPETEAIAEEQLQLLSSSFPPNATTALYTGPDSNGRRQVLRDNNLELTRIRAPLRAPLVYKFTIPSKGPPAHVLAARSALKDETALPNSPVSPGANTVLVETANAAPTVAMGPLAECGVRQKVLEEKLSSSLSPSSGEAPVAPRGKHVRRRSLIHEFEPVIPNTQASQPIVNDDYDHHEVFLFESTHGSGGSMTSSSVKSDTLQPAAQAGSRPTLAPIIPTSTALHPTDYADNVSPSDMSVPPSPLYLGSPSVPMPAMQSSGMTGSSSSLGSQRGRRRSSHSHKHASGDDIDELLLSEEEAERKRAARKYEVQRCEPNPNSVLRRNTSFRGSTHASPTSATTDANGSTSPHLSPSSADPSRPGSSHGGGSLLGRLFHTDHTSSSHSPSHSPILSPESKPHAPTVKRSSSIIDKLDRMIHPDHDNTTPVLPTSSAATGAESPPASAEPSRSSSPIMGLLTRKKSEAANHSPRSASAHGSTRLHRSNSESSMNEKYGITKEFLGKGANATVRLAHKLVDKSTADHHHGHHGHHHHHHGHHHGHHGHHSEHPSTATTRSDAVPHTGTATGSAAPTGSAMPSVNPSVVANDDTSRHSSAGQLSRTMSLSKSSSFSGASEQGDTVVPMERLFAIKKFRKRRKEESEKDYIKKLSAEFCISSSLHHPHVIETVDLIQDEQDQWCEVMEYMSGGDLFARIANGPPMSVGERDCLFAQLIEGVGYLHSIGVAHRDLKPENLLLDADGRTLKIADFGTSEVFRVPWAKDRRRVKGICGSDPYIAPEEWSGNSYEPDLVDVWATGIIFFVMVHKTIPWKAAVKTDPHYANFLETRRTGMFEYLDELPGGEEGPRDLLYEILEPDPTRRITCEGIVKNRWFQLISVCEPGKAQMTHSHYTGSSSS